MPDPSPPTLSPLDERKAAWLADRKSGIGGSEVAAILLPPEMRPAWCNPLAVWLDKKGLAEDKEMPWMAAGKKMERTILEMYSEDVQEPIAFADPFAFLRDPQLPILGASLDARWLVKDQRPVDAKNLRFKDPKIWGDPGSDRVKPVYGCQLHSQIIVTGAPCADLAVLFSGVEREVFTVWRDEEIIATIRERVEAWWKRHIIGNVQPDIDGSDIASDWLARRFKQTLADLLEPSDAVRATAAELLQIKAAVKDLTAEQKRLENVMKEAIGEAAGFLGLCTWKKAKDSSGFNYEAAYKAVFEGHDPIQFLSAKKAEGPAALDAFLGSFKTSTPGSRRFLLNAKDDE